MKWWHRHQWELIGKTYTSPIRGKATMWTEESMLKVFLGATNIEQRCKSCGWTRITTVAGRA